MFSISSLQPGIVLDIILCYCIPFHFVYLFKFTSSHCEPILLYKQKLVAYREEEEEEEEEEENEEGKKERKKEEGRKKKEEETGHLFGIGGNP